MSLASRILSKSNKKVNERNENANPLRSLSYVQFKLKYINDFVEKNLDNTENLERNLSTIEGHIEEICASLKVKLIDDIKDYIYSKNRQQNQ